MKRARDVFSAKSSGGSLWFGVSEAAIWSGRPWSKVRFRVLQAYNRASVAGTPVAARSPNTSVQFFCTGCVAVWEQQCLWVLRDVQVVVLKPH